ncbi:alpha-glucuronidase family glycosyl hydrolase [Alkalitalea saponilacus]|uniref:Xylan alpha-1,2-glucuronidase n=1 Tax=Alkalitalea saponilacus TaxID=889453 RepID=A0A1T5HSX6_9BACT|nr:alpha-glucuronidase family glycosyl hydrolase [Alkalitalea saponilacus]ASB47664.1 alpha-glucuronidase [Alkalitalea saponilacus]SKC23805.1 alpha-glucuronidase [Alkalitalea saponilacus]
MSGKICRLLVLFFLLPNIILAESGEKLWLRYLPLDNAKVVDYTNAIRSLVVAGDDAVISAAAEEIQMAFNGLTGNDLRNVNRPGAGALLIGTPENRLIRDLELSSELEKCGEEGYIIRTFPVRNGQMTVIAANTSAGVLYGTFDLIRRMQTGESISKLEVNESPAFKIRVLNHWDNLNGTVERGYAGHSIWFNRPEDWSVRSAQYKYYARANASVGINGTVINNVNADPNVLTAEYIEKYARIADIFRPYNMKIYMSVNFASPAVIGGLENSDPFNPAVQQWWKDKAAEIYQSIPDFGGFLVKANSEGQPGPMDYGRTHKDGANMMAKALQPHNGIVMWRAFVYEPGDDERSVQAYNEFMPFDGEFEDNVIVQVKNGPVDFMPRESFSPLFGGMQKSPVMIEFQITQEYLGHSNHLAYLSTMWKEVLDAETFAKGVGSSVAKTTDGTLFNHELTAISAVSNIGRDINWTGHHFGQSNWYAFGRLAWDYDLLSEDIAEEWVKMTFVHDQKFVEPVVDIMMRSREAVVNYMNPLGLHHIMGWDHHFGPEPWTDIPGAREDWLPRYYHNASEFGIGFDRTTNGSNLVSQYHSPLNKIYNDPLLVPENLLLWFHHLPWNYRLQNGLKLWDAMVYKYYEGVEEARLFQNRWDRLEGYIDDRRFKEIQYKLKLQTTEAIWWRDACVLYFQTYSNLPIPAELERPVHDLDELKELKFDMKHHN